MWAMMELFVVIDNISSVSRIIEFAKVVYGFGIKNLIFTHVYGSAAQQGIPEVFKLALKYSTSLIILSTLKDALELVRPDHVIAIRRPSLKAKDIRDLTGIEGKVAVIVDGSDQDIKVEWPSVHDITTGYDIGNVGQLAITLYLLAGGRGNARRS